MRIMRVLALFAAAIAFGASASGQLVAGYGSAWYGPLTPPFYGVGGYSGYNAANASDYDFYNVGGGPFYWYALGSGQTLPSSPSMILNGTTLTVTQVNGNSSTATALAATPTQCTTGAFATGIKANGDANCSSAGASIQALTITSGICTTAGAETTCSMTETWPVAFANATYAVTCSYAALPTGTGTNPGLYGPYVSAKSTTGFTLTIQSGSNSAGGNNTVAEIDCTGIE